VKGLEGGRRRLSHQAVRLPELLRPGHALIPAPSCAIRTPTLKVDDLTLDPLTRRVTPGERVVDLSPREFALLEFLMRNVGRSVSRSRIAEAVWNYQFDPERTL